MLSHFSEITSDHSHRKCIHQKKIIMPLKICVPLKRSIKKYLKNSCIHEMENKFKFIVELCGFNV